jgi:hypothetical protein
MFLFSFTQSPFIAHFLRAARFVLNAPVPLTERLPFISRQVAIVIKMVLSQTLDEDERIYHFMLSTQPKHKTALLVFGTRSLESPAALCEWHA